MRFNLATSAIAIVSMLGSSASALPLLHRHHRTVVIENPPATYVQPAPVVQPAPTAPQVNVQVNGQRGGGPGSPDGHQLQEQQQLLEHQRHEQQDLQEHQAREANQPY